MPRRKQKIKYSRKIACKHLTAKGEISNCLQPLCYCVERDIVLGTKAYVCQVCASYIQVKSNRAIDDLFLESKKSAEKKIKEKAEAIKLEELEIEEAIETTIEEFEEDDSELPSKYEKRKVGKSEAEDISEEFQNICPFCDEIFDDLASHIRDCEFAPEDASIEDIMPSIKKKKRKKKRGKSSSKSAEEDEGDSDKKKCPYCGKEFMRLGRHINSCKKKPAGEKGTKGEEEEEEEEEGDYDD